MSLILAIEPNRTQAQQLNALVRTHLKAELVTATTAAAALTALGDRIPDVILTPALVSPRDEAALTERLRDLGSAVSHVQTLAIPILASGSSRGSGGGGLLGRKRDKGDDVGCDPAVFAEQIRIYLQRAAVERRAHASEAAARVVAATAPPPAAAASESSADFNSFFVSADELDVSSLEIPDLIVAPPPSAPKAAPVAMPERVGVPAARPATAAPPAGTVEKNTARRPASRSAEPPPEPGEVEAELGLVTPPTAGPPLWQVTESIEDFYNGEGSDGLTVPPAAPDAPAPTLIGAIPTPVPESSGPSSLPAPPAQPAGRHAAPPTQRPAAPKSKRTSSQSDDWTYFDPSQSAFKALIKRLDEIAGSAA